MLLHAVNKAILNNHLSKKNNSGVGNTRPSQSQIGTKFSVTNLMLGLGLLRVIHKNLNSRQQFTWDRLWQAYQRGCHSHFDSDTWQPELLWHLLLTDVQALFSIVKN
ncbi:MAG: hypothetical protein V7K71_03285 [Nostoc sp.]|uniref:hypothetical protein n=1 Tax=Nostoc sp. TaxID=1180 RepID=UPI002FF5BE15